MAGYALSNSGYVPVKLLSACTGITATLSGKTAEELDKANLAEAKHLLQTLENTNSSLRNFKGIGKIKVWRNARVQFDERVAWLGSDPLKIRIEVLISGFPAVKLASDGQWFYFLEMQLILGFLYSSLKTLTKLMMEIKYPLMLKLVIFRI